MPVKWFWQISTEFESVPKNKPDFVNKIEDKDDGNELSEQKVSDLKQTSDKHFE